MSDALRLYYPEECDPVDGYPFAWHDTIKMLIREQAGNKCVRCLHPYEKGMGEWSPCSEECRHTGPMRVMTTEGWSPFAPTDEACGAAVYAAGVGNVEAQWRVLTTHHLNMVKADCRWFNLVPLCQRCHLTVQGKVRMDRPWPWEHSDWFKPYVAAFYAIKYLGVREITQDEVEETLDDLLAMGMAHEREERLPV